MAVFFSQGVICKFTFIGEPWGRFLWQQDRRSLATRTVPVARRLDKPEFGSVAEMGQRTVPCGRKWAGEPSLWLK